ncbi:MAG: dephospho-CoA kinase [Oscillospiraceae bacterium]|nr:dephospho-CoA kinase [Oscillospiraceae bacterium]
MKNATLIGLTGQTGAGKSTVCSLIENMGFIIIDADKVSREVVDTDINCLVDLVMKFSCGILNENGKLNRKRLASIVFSDPKQLVTLNKTIFPYITARIEKHIDELGQTNNNPVVVLDAPTLFESGIDMRCDYIVSVLAEKDIRIDRIIQRDGLSGKEAMQRVNAQHEDSFYTERSNHIIYNNGDHEELKQRTTEVFEYLLEKIAKENSENA